MNQTPEMDEKKTSSPETAPIAATTEHNANFEEKYPLDHPQRKTGKRDPG